MTEPCTYDRTFYNRDLDVTLKNVCFVVLHNKE